MNERRVLLIGGGHAHALALLRLARRPDLKIVLASEDDFAPYSGMLPGFIAGQFSREECMVNLPRLCRKTGAQFVRARAVFVNGNTARFADGSTIHFDAASVNVGGAQSPPFAAPGAPVKPVARFMDFLQTLSDTPSLAIVGAGAGGAETAMALRRRFANAAISLVGDSLLPGASDSTRQLLQNALQQKQIRFYQSTAKQFGDGSLALHDGQQIAAEHIVFATPVAAPEWLGTCDFNLDSGGFIKVNSFLQSESFPTLFAAGDCAASGAPKSGVIAVRQAPVLAHNIAAFLSKQELISWQPRRRLLSILNTADGKAIAAWGTFSAQGQWAWHWKKILDQAFMNKLS